MDAKDKIHQILFGKSKPYSLDEVLKIGKETPLKFRIEKLRGSLMRWNPTMISEFDYGEVPSMINDADEMPWDIIIAPGSSAKDKDLLISGLIKVAADAENIPYPHGNKIGNDKLILSKDGKLTEYDKKFITKYFQQSDAFDEPKFF